MASLFMFIFLVIKILFSGSSSVSDFVATPAFLRHRFAFMESCLASQRGEEIELAYC